LLKNSPWECYRPYQSVAYTQTCLQSIYEKNGIEKAEVKSYQNSYPFVYYLEHGKKHYTLAHNAPRELKPLLLFYGMTQLIKACLLTVDPKYPKTTAVLAHGVSTRKRKKRGYTFLEDEVKIQKNGLVTHFTSQLFHVERLEGEKFRMKELMQRIPDLNHLFATIYGTSPFYPVNRRDDSTANMPGVVLDDLHMTFTRYRDYFKTHAHAPLTNMKQTENGITVGLEGANFHCHPFYRSLGGDCFVPAVRGLYHYLPETVVHFLLLYNLSMISRYETEWWSELFHHSGTNDLPFIDAFLDVTVEKTPLLLAFFLRSNNDPIKTTPLR
jgi:hypothetical protein